MNRAGEIAQQYKYLFFMQEAQDQSMVYRVPRDPQGKSPQGTCRDNSGGRECTRA